MRQLKEQKTVEMFKLEIDIGEDDEIHADDFEKPVVPDSGDFLGFISGSVDEHNLGENRNIIILFTHRVTVNKMQKMLQPHLSGNTVAAGWGH